MKLNFRLFILTLFSLVPMLLAACGQAIPLTGDEIKPVMIDRSSDENTPTKEQLAPEAAKRLDIQTEAVSEDSMQYQTIPISALLYDTQGDTWVYTNPQPLTFVRTRVIVDHIDGNEVYLIDRLPKGTRVVTVGSAELYGAEFEFEEE